MFQGTKSLVEVGISMVLQDRFTRDANMISKSFRNVLLDMYQMNQGIRMSTGAAFETSKDIISGLGKAYEHYAGVYNDVFLATKMAGGTKQQANDLLQTAKDINAITPLTSADVASGERFLAMAGNSVERIQHMIGPAAKLASIFSMPLGGKGGVADLMTNIMATFNIDGALASRVADHLYTATTSANISLIDLAQSFQYAGEQMRNANLDIATGSAIIGVLGDQGIQASSAGTAAANMYRYLAKTVTGQRESGINALKSLGLDPKSLIDAKGNLIAINKLIPIIGDALSRQGIGMEQLDPTNMETGVLGGTRLSTILGDLVNIRGARALSALLFDYWSGRNKLNIIMDKMSQDTGQVNKVIDEWLEESQGKIKQFQSNWENLVTSVGGQVASIFNPVLTIVISIEKILTKFSEGTFGGIVVRTATWFTTIQMVRFGILTIKRVFDILKYSQIQLNASIATQKGQVSSINAGYSVMITQLETILALMINIAKAQGATGMFATGAGIRKRGGKYGFVGGRTGIGISQGITAAAIMKAMGSSGSNINNTGKMLQEGTKLGLKGLGGRLIGFLGGPWGFGLSIGIPLIYEVVKKIWENSEEDKEKQELTDTEWKANQDAELLKALREYIRKSGDSDINITINGIPVGSVSPGGSADIGLTGDDLNLF